MKKTFDYLYIFSRFSISFILLVCLFGTLYILFINYQKQSNISKNQLFYEKELKENINNNSEKINKIATEINFNKKVLNEIKQSIVELSNKNKLNDLSSINNDIDTLINNFNKLSNEFQDLKQNNFSKTIQKNNDTPNIINKSKTDIIELILIKYENNIKFNQELEYLKNIISKNEITNIEKISVLSSNKFKGNDYLIKTFNTEVDIFLKKIINNNPKSLLNKIILPYIQVSPATENFITSDTAIIIKEIKANIKNKQISEALKNLKTINDYQNYFKLTYTEFDKYIDFKTELYKLK